jgi:hypothetical protein
MNKRILFLVFAIFAASVRVDAEPVVIRATVPDGYNTWEVYSAYQVDDEVWVVQLSSFLTPIQMKASEEIDFGCPAIKVTKVISQYAISELGLTHADRIYSCVEGDETRPYDDTIGDGWVNHSFYGWCWVGSYPWVYVWNYHQWVYMSSDGPVQIDDDIANSWWIWTEDRGWYWTAPEISLWQWSCDDNAWVIPDE